MAKIKGDALILYVWDSVDLDYRPIACLTSNTLNSTREVLTSQTKCAPGVVEKESGVFDYNITADGEYIDTTSVGGDTTKASHDYLLEWQQAGDKRTWKMDTGLADTTAYYGTSLLTDLTLTGDSGQIATFSATLEGDGAIVTVDPNAGT